MSETGFRSGMLIFPDMTQLDLTGPYEVLARRAGSR
jgi:putative intracellular protease/amidase